MQLDYTKSQQILSSSTVLINKQEIEQVIDNLAKTIDVEIAGDLPLFLTVMNGGMMFAAELTKRLVNPIQMDYIHASRYANSLYGSSYITWYKQPQASQIKGRTVYVIDDILDEGYTISEINQLIMNLGAAKCKIVVLIDKDIGKQKPINADHVGVIAPNKFLFGYGMDIFGINRNLQEIYVYNSND